MSEDVTVTQPRTFQGVTLWVGDEDPITVHDAMSPRDLPDLMPAPLQRAVVVARLQTIVDALQESALEERMGAIRAVAVGPTP